MALNLSGAILKIKPRFSSGQIGVLVVLKPAQTDAVRKKISGRRSLLVLMGGVFREVPLASIGLIVCQGNENQKLRTPTLFTQQFDAAAHGIDDSPHRRQPQS